jgi:hypothetical protein
MIAILGMLSAVAFGADPGPVKFKTHANIWAAHDQTGEFPVDAEGTMGGQGGHIEMRSILGLKLSNKEVVVEAEIGGLSGQIWGEHWAVPGSIDQRNRHKNGLAALAPRTLKIGANLPVGQLEMGLMTSHWGLGMLANDGEHNPYFGLPEFGDRVMRARFTTKPSKDSPWHFTGAWDRVVEDELTIDASNQWTHQGILSTLWTKGNDKLGVYAVSRQQDELLTGRTTRAGVLDAFADTHTRVANGVKLRLAFEAAGISGKTNRSTTTESPRRIHIRSGGATALGMLSVMDDRLKFGASSGFASGDGDPTDDTSHDFTFDRNFGVGMILFDEVQGGIDAATYNLVTNPEYAGQAPDGVEATVHEGAFRRASYIQPRIQVKPLPWLVVRTGVLFASATAPIAHPFYTLRNGGTPVNQLKEETEGYRLGTEFDWSLTIKTMVADKHPLYRTRLSIQGGHAYLDENLGGSHTDRVDRFIVMFQAL